MKVQLHSTVKTVDLVTRWGHAVPARVWEGTTEGGVPVIAFITRIAAKDDADLSEFERDLLEMTPPSPDVAAWPARMLID